MPPESLGDLEAWLASGRKDPRVWFVPGTADRLVRAVEDGLVDLSQILVPALHVLSQQDIDLWRRAEQGDAPRDAARVIKAFSNPLGLLLLRNSLIPFPVAELVLTAVRRMLLLGERPPGDHLDFVAALAEQCFLNEYCFFQEPNEERLLATLKPHEPYDFALLSCYVAPQAAPLADDPRLGSLIARTVTAPRLERELAARIPKLTPIEDVTSRAVRAMYEENPYPRWVRARRGTPAPAPEALKQYFPTMDAQAFGAPQVAKALIAGCGTGQHVVRFCGMFGATELTAIDLSLASLSYAKRSTDALGLRVDYAQADLLALNGTYDIIDCIGVLHHLADPMAGWRRLLACLRPGGVMRIGLYSAPARSGFSTARRFARKIGAKPTTEGIRLFRREVLKQVWARPAKPPPLLTLTQMADFYSTSMCRDLVFHVQEHQFAMGDVVKMTNELGLKFLGVLFNDAGSQEAYVTRFPDDPYACSPRSLVTFERERTESFRDMVVFGAQKPITQD